MMAELGLAALWLAAALAVLQLAGGIAVWRQAAGWEQLLRPAAILQGLLAAFAFGALLWVFAITDLSVALVGQHSHSAKPLVYKITGAWGNHEGSMLLWITVMALAGALVAGAERRLDTRTFGATLAAQAVVGLGFYAFLLFSSNPFARSPARIAEGSGLNPVLQDMGLLLHPPVLYAGYVGLSVAFSFAVGAMLTNRVDAAFARAMRPWVLGAWICLTLGITAGSWWAYYELGWGGWWFWDPVENASLMPWLAATALLHSTNVLAAREGLRNWTLMLAVLAFSMSMLGTFLVRSGILTSVHAFAVDPERGTFILALLVLYIGGALALFALRARHIDEGERFAAVSREGALVVNNVLLSAILGVVLLGTLYPLLTEAFDVRVSVGPPYFDPVSAIFFLPLVAVLLVGPLLRWRGDRLERLKRPAVLIGTVLLATAIAVLALGGAGLLPALGMVLGVGLVIASFLPLKGRRIARAPLALWGMMIAHAGIGIALVGVAADSAFSQETLVAAAPGDAVAIGPYAVTFAGVAPLAGPNWTAMEATLEARRGDGRTQLLPQQRSYWTPVQQTSESVQLTDLDGQLYAVLGAPAGDGRWQVRLWWKPFVTLIWLGGIVVALGGLLALLGRVSRDVRRAYIERRMAERREA